MEFNLGKSQKFVKFSISDWHKRFQQQSTWTQDFRSYLFRNIITEKNLKFLEVGSGTGVITEQLTKLDHSLVCGLDISLERVQFAQKYDPMSCFSAADGLHLPFPDESFNVTCCHYYLMWTPSPMDALAEMVRVTITSGHIAVLAEPDYKRRNDLPEACLEIGTAQYRSLQMQGANPDIGGKLKELFQQLSLNIEEAGIYQSGSILGEKESIRQEIAVLRNDLSYLFNDVKITKMISHFKQTLKTKNFHWSIPTHYMVGKK
jgi:ubiquinone/menaquinone biosynthesis C-methylase UbiE